MTSRLVWTIALIALLALPVSAWGRQEATQPAASAPAESGGVHGSHHEHGGHHGRPMHEGRHGGHDEGYTGGHRSMMEKCMAMKERSDKAAADIQAMDERIREKMEALKNAADDRKLEAMEAVVTELVSQRKEMGEKLGDMHHHQIMCAMRGRGGHHHGMWHDGHGGPHGKCPMAGGTEHRSEGRGGEGDSGASQTVN